MRNSLFKDINDYTINIITDIIHVQVFSVIQSIIAYHKTSMNNYLDFNRN